MEVGYGSDDGAKGQAEPKNLRRPWYRFSSASEEGQRNNSMLFKTAQHIYESGVSG
jgi:hypothetical protein